MLILLRRIADTTLNKYSLKSIALWLVPFICWALMIRSVWWTEGFGYHYDGVLRTISIDSGCLEVRRQGSPRGVPSGIDWIGFSLRQTGMHQWLISFADVGGEHFIRVPWWMVNMPISIGALFWYRRLGRDNSGLCKQCGYSLQGLDPRTSCCPECGRHF